MNARLRWSLACRQLDGGNTFQRAVQKELPQPSDVAAAEEKPEARQEKPENVGDSKAQNRIFTISVLLELSYCLIGPKALELILTFSLSGLVRFLLMCIPHTLIALIGRLYVKKNKQKLTADQHGELFASNFFAWCGSTLLAVIIGTFLIPLEMNGILKFLMALGLNIAPALIALVIHFTLVFSDNKN